MTTLKAGDIKAGQRLGAYKERVYTHGALEEVVEVDAGIIPDSVAKEGLTAFKLVEPHRKEKVLGSLVVEQSDDTVEVGIILGEQPGPLTDLSLVQKLSSDVLRVSCKVEEPGEAVVHLTAVSDEIEGYTGPLEELVAV
jgi:hypothetical protein